MKSVRDFKKPQILARQDYEFNRRFKFIVGASAKTLIFGMGRS
ncbi:hypothetical protein M272_10900 [Vibrio natriegens NBRC 15636 = ATCC 14048 = DSM 759]|nr:hypothetical protein M272_10900 [Vibrio natriegens NBRC 15636 = ATCC 14048 = DSM 759]